MPANFDPNLAITQNPQYPEQIQVDIKGLYDYPNQFSPTSLPQGALLVATNCVLETPGRVARRRGFGVYGNTTGTPNQGLTFTTYDGGRLLHCDDNRIYVDGNDGQFDALSATQYYVPGSYAGSRVRFQEMNGNLYFNSNTGIYKIQSLSTAPILSGGPQALGGNVTAVLTAANNGPLPNASSVAYRALWEYTDANQNLIRGVPSNPLIANNSNNTSYAQVELAWTIPTTVDTTWTFKVYRSNYGENPAPPDDNGQLVYSANCTNAQITARSITFTDNVPDVDRGELIYTAAQGIANSEYRPPIAQDLTLYKGCMFYGNCKTYQQLLLTLQNEGLQAGDNVTFWQGSTKLFTCTAGSSENAPGGVFKVFTGNGQSIDLDQTAQSFCNVVNYNSGNNSVMDAYYLSVINVSQVGQMLFQLRNYTDTPFYATCSNNALQFFSPNLQTSGNTINTLSTDTAFQNRLYFSKSLQPEAVPLGFWFAIGSETTPIVRTIPFRDSLAVIKTDGIYAVTGNDPTTFTVYPMDVQQNIAGINTPAVLNNYLYFLGQQGLVQMDEYGNHTIISLPIQQSLMQYTTNNYPNFTSASWAMAYQAAHKYILWTVSEASDSTAQQAFVYDWTTNAWTTWNKNFTCGVVDPIIGTLWATNFTEGNVQIYQERKSLTDADYSDEQYAVTLTAQHGVNLNVASVPSSALVGDSLEQSPYTSVITAIDSTNNFITVEDNVAWNVNSTPASICTGVPVTVTVCPLYGNDPTQKKQFAEFSMIVDGTSEATFDVTITTDAFVQDDSITMSIPTQAGTTYGTGTFGVGPFGGASLTVSGSRLRNYIPRAIQRCNWLVYSFQSSTAFNSLGFSGIQMVYRPIGTRQR